MEFDPLTEADQLNDYRCGQDGGCPVSTGCSSGALHTDQDVIGHLLSSHSAEELAWALLVESACTFRLHDLISYRYDQRKQGPVPYQTSSSPDADEETNTVLNTVASTTARQVPSRIRHLFT